MNRLQKAAAFGAMMGKRAGLGGQPALSGIEKVVKPATPPVNPGVALETPKIVDSKFEPGVLAYPLREAASLAFGRTSLSNMAFRGALNAGKYINNAYKQNIPIKPHLDSLGRDLDEQFRSLFIGAGAALKGKPRRDAGKG